MLIDAKTVKLIEGRLRKWFDAKEIAFVGYAIEEDGSITVYEKGAPAKNAADKYRIPEFPDIHITVKKYTGLPQRSKQHQRFQIHFIPDKTAELGTGLIHIITGNGKGKTTSALGMAVRTIMHGGKAAVIQFMKSPDSLSGEHRLPDYLPNFHIKAFGSDFFVDIKHLQDADKIAAQRGFEYAKEIINSGEYHLVILDEINVAVRWKLLPLEYLLDLIDNKPEHLELVLTGRQAHPSVIERAHYHTEIKSHKHPYQSMGILARKGVEW